MVSVWQAADHNAVILQWGSITVFFTTVLMHKIQSLTGYCDCWTALVPDRLNKMKDTSRARCCFIEARAKCSVFFFFSKKRQSFKMTLLKMQIFFISQVTTGHKMSPRLHSTPVPSQWMCTEGFKSQHHSDVCWILDQDWLFVMS